IVFDKPLSDGSFNKLSNRSKPSCFVFQYSCRLVSERYCVSKKWLRILSTIPASTPVPNCPGIFDITREGTVKRFVALNSTRCLEYPFVFTFEILCPVVYNTHCCSNNLSLLNS